MVRVVDRTVAKTIVFVSSKEYVPKNEEKLKYKIYVYEPGWTIRGTVEHITKGWIKIKDKETPTTLIVFRNDKDKYCLMIPEQIPYYILNMPILSEGDTIEITYAGMLDKNIGFFKKGAKIINIKRIYNEK